MVSALSSALGGLAAATQRLNVSAANIAQQDSTETVQRDGSVTATPYAPQQLVQSSDPNGGVSAHTEPVTPASIPVSDPGNPAAGSDGITHYPNVDPAQQLVQAKIASYDAQGNISVLKAQDRMFKSMLNIVS